MVKKATKKTTKSPKQPAGMPENFEPTKVGLAVAATASISLVVLGALATTA